MKTLKFFTSFFILFNTSFALANCPSSKLELSEFQIKKENLEKVKSGLDSVVDGKLSQSTSLSMLFTVSLEDPEQINARKKELVSFLEQNLNHIQCDSEESTQLLKDIQQLEISIARARLNFLNLPEKQRVAFLALQKEAIRNQSEIESLQKVGEKAEEKIEAAAEAIKKAEELSLVAESSKIRELAAAIANIERFRKSIAEETSSITEKMKLLGDEYQSHTNKLGEISAVISKSNASASEVDSAYKRVAIEWRSIVDEVVKIDNILSENTDLKLPNYQKELISAESEELQKESERYQNSFSAAQNELEALKELNLKFSSSKRELSYRELVVTGQIRSQLIRMLESFGDDSPFKISDSYIEDLIREIKLVPYRPKALIVSGINKIKETASKGIEGVLGLIRSLFLMLFFVIIPILSFIALRRLLSSIEDSRKKMIRNRYTKKPSKILTWLLNMKPYLPWLVMLIAFNFSQSVVEGTELNWLSDLMPYFNFYFIYKLFRVFINNNLFTIYRLTRSKLTPELQKRIEKTSRFLGLYFLISAYLLETTAAVARRALFFRLTSDLLIYCTPVVLALTTYYWRNEITKALKNTLSPNLYEKLSVYMQGPLAILLSLPLAIFLISSVVFKKLKEELFEVDSIKSISAQLFKKQIESNLEEAKASKSKRVLQESYKDFFKPSPLEDMNLFVQSSEVLSEMEDTIEKWRRGESDIRSIAIYGDKGIGKSSILNALKTNCEETRIDLKKKITSNGEFYRFLSSDCGFDIDPSKDVSEQIHDIDSKLETKRLIIIDNLQNFFLSHRKGFEAYRSFASLLTLRTKNIFWCVSINTYSWLYLNAVNNESQIFRKVFHVQAWDDEEIKEMILARHKLSNFDLKFDPVIYSLGSTNNDESFKYVQDRFFELLWEQSRGNPRTALALWLSALSPTYSNKLNVGLPGGELSQKIEGLNEDELFVISSIIRHENLDTKSAKLVTGLDENTVQHAVRVGVERGYLQRADDGTYRITPIWQPVVIRDLSGKNLIYG
ncbi:MAG: hypothetical protein VX583_06450 [Bdellovibrionota bacterium]|nr:hypothetical protein [Pseudobdellovibrionaceae bacterium]